MRILSPTLPIPVSFTPMFAKISAFSCVFLRIFEMICSLWSKVMQQTFFCASIEALIASFMSLNTPCIPDTLPVICIFAMTCCTMSCTMRSSTDTLLPPSMRMPHKQPDLYLPGHCPRIPPRLQSWFFQPSTVLRLLISSPCHHC